MKRTLRLLALLPLLMPLALAAQVPSHVDSLVESRAEEAARRLITAIEQPKTAMVERIVVRGKLIEGSSVKDIQKV